MKKCILYIKNINNNLNLLDQIFVYKLSVPNPKPAADFIKAIAPNSSI